MVGLQSLAPGQAPMPGQGQMAGQPAMPGMLPKPQGIQPGVPALVPSLVGMGMGRLLQMFADPNSPVPKNRILAAMTEQQQAAEAKAAVERQMAMAQNAAAPTGTIAQQVVQRAMRAAQPTQMAAHGGVMRGYAGGGAVAFQSGGNMLVEQILKKSPYERTPEENEILRAAGVEVTRKSLPQEGGVSSLNRLLEAPFIRRMFTGDTYKLSPEELAKRTDTGATTERMFRALGGSQFVEPPVAPAAAEQSTDTGDELARLLGRAPAPVLMRDTRGAAPTPSAPSGGQRRQPAASAPPAPSLVTTATPANLTPEMAKAYLEQEENLQGRLKRRESLTKAEEGLAALAKANIEAQQAEAKTYGEEIRAARDAALARSQRDILSDPMSLLALAGSIDTRKGQGVGSLARGAAGLMGEREKQAEAARKEFALAQRDERAMQANVRQTQMLEGQRQVALEKGKLDEVNAINDQLSNLALEREKFRLTRGDVAFQQAMKSREVAAEEEKARAAKISAGKPTELEQRIRLFQQNPEQYRTMFGIDPKETSVELRALKDEEQQLLKRLETTMLPEAKKPIEARLDDIIKMRRTLMGAAPAPAATTTTAPAVGTVMQGYRFKGGNPADKNNWEKV